MARLDIPQEILVVIVIGGVVVASILGLLLLWAVISFVNSHRRIAKSLEQLNETIDSLPQKKDDGEPTEWILEEPAKPDREKS